MKLISKKRLYEKISKLETQARKNLAKTPRDSEEYIRYETQFNERSAFKHMVMDERESDIEQKLASYEKAEEQGLLIRIPCRVGDYVYYVTENRRVVETFVHRIIIHDGYAFLAFANGKIMYSYDFDKTVFLTRAEAETALAEMGE